MSSRETTNKLGSEPSFDMLADVLRRFRDQLDLERNELVSERQRIAARLRTLDQQIREWETTKRFLSKALMLDLRSATEVGASRARTLLSDHVMKQGITDPKRIAQKGRLLEIIETARAEERRKKDAYDEANPRPPTISEFALDQIRSAGASGLTSLAITERFNKGRVRGVKRESVREALRRLAQDGFIRRQKQVWFSIEGG